MSRCARGSVVKSSGLQALRPAHWCRRPRHASDPVSARSARRNVAFRLAVLHADGAEPPLEFWIDVADRDVHGSHDGVNLPSLPHHVKSGLDVRRRIRFPFPRTRRTAWLPINSRRWLLNQSTWRTSSRGWSVHSPCGSLGRLGGGMDSSSVLGATYAAMCTSTGPASSTNRRVQSGGPRR